MGTNKKISVDELLKEFIDLYRNPNKNVPRNVDAVIILAGDRPPMRGENISRIKYATTLLKKIKKNIPIIFSGITEKKETTIKLMRELDIPKENCRFQGCGKLGIANTKTQFETLITDPLTKNLKNLVIVTSSYHIPRVKRTAEKFLPPETKFVVVGDPEDWTICNNFIKIMEEINKIIKYSDKGNISVRSR